jgi:hypothetical protein
MLSHDVGWFVTDISGHDVQEINTSKKKSLSSWTSWPFLDILALEGGTNLLSQNVGDKPTCVLQEARTVKI